MSKHYKIHPGIGVARVGKSTDGYFLQADTENGAPFELSETGETAFRGYKDASHLIRKQGVRFRVFEYEKDDASGKLTFTGEVTADKATIKWSVKLGSRKAAGPLMGTRVGPQGEAVVVPGNTPRNPGIDRNRLIAEASLSGLTGKNLPLQDLGGSIMDKPVTLGSAGTDLSGNLVILAGHGNSDSWEDSRPDIVDYLNNNGWFDDIADGPVDAELTFADGHSEKVHEGAWVMTAPPDFAPGIHPFVSLYDLIFDVFVQNGRLPHPSRVSFEHDILPILRRAADHRWINNISEWKSLATALNDVNSLADNSDAVRPRREAAHRLILRSEVKLRFFRLTKTQKEDYLAKWLDGDFESDLGSARPDLNAAEEMDRAVLKRCIGSGLFPGIEMGFMATNKELYTEVGRFTRGQFTDFNGPASLKPGSATERMALPWQADFMECLDVWWPSQRPDIVIFNEDGTPADLSWDRGLKFNDDPEDPRSHLNMVEHFAQLGVIDVITVGSERVFAEIGRDTSLPDENPSDI